MTSQAEKLLEDALRLPPETRAALAGSLLSSLDEVADEDAATAWQAEVAKRLEEIDSGQVRLVSRDDAQNNILLGMFLGTE